MRNALIVGMAAFILLLLTSCTNSPKQQSRDLPDTFNFPRANAGTALFREQGDTIIYSGKVNPDTYVFSIVHNSGNSASESHLVFSKNNTDIFLDGIEQYRFTVDNNNNITLKRYVLTTKGWTTK